MTPEKKIKLKRTNIRNIVRSSSTQEEAINKLVSEDYAISKAQAKRMYFQIKAVKP